MADTKVSALTAVAAVAGTNELPVNEAGTSKKATAQQLRTYIGAGLTDAATVAVAGGYAADTYLANSSITIPTAGAWVAGSFYRCTFNMTKTAAGTATPIITVRMGTLGTTADAAICTVTYSAGTAAVDDGTFDVIATFRSVGAATAAVLNTTVSLVHNLASTGLTSSATVVRHNLSAGFASTTQTIIGLSFNGGASFSGSTETVVATLSKYQ